MAVRTVRWLMNLSAKNSNPNHLNNLFFSWDLSLIETLRPLAHSFYLRSATKVAPELLGKGLYVRHKKKHFLCQIIEVEAYLGSTDPASHAFKGPTQRNRSMFEQGGTCYVYLSYGLNYCMNVVTDIEGKGSAVLIRSAVPLFGLKEIAKNRHISGPLDAKNMKNLLSGPGKLTQGLGINRSFDGMRFDQDALKIVDLKYTVPKKQLGFSPRIGISKAKEKNLRFFIKGSEFLSRP
ncbi:MAG: DNA-3-methyladenine glycosylase [Deltaproteobacteria bacterium]|nr:DNA-3-methyladenine glycosylase [Deltaproteobacteria bacterium]